MKISRPVLGFIASLVVFALSLLGALRVADGPLKIQFESSSRRALRSVSGDFSSRLLFDDCLRDLVGFH